MELSVLPATHAGSADAEAFKAGIALPASAQLALFDVLVPSGLQRFGPKVRASALGDPANPAVVVLGGISADCFPGIRPDGSSGWWSGLAGAGKALDLRTHYIVGADFAADESGGAAPTTHDQARVLAAVLDAVGIDRPCAIVGASYGAMVALALAEIEPERVDRLVIVSAGCEPHPAATAARELQRRIVALGLGTGQQAEALAIARGLAMLTYRTPAEFEQRFEGGIAADCPLDCSSPGAYLRARGEDFLSVMSPGRFLSLSASIDRHRVSAEKIRTPALLIGAESDQLVPPGQMRDLADRLGGKTALHLLGSLFGHDMFLKEAGRVGEIVAPFLECRR